MMRYKYKGLKPLYHYVDKKSLRFYYIDSKEYEFNHYDIFNRKSIKI